ncbi:sugar ABC transporter permease [Ensifer adhaerens]|uniref:carbohydrate ABC transporter permease n=1 Tax=Ensifer adhaerens TaxID=106592 RepID=UPI001CBC1FFA|nr:sugar ABC transporter permease [Ensifer adhaerens]MBZ7924377.1 sugar ABC transporter permease [Ensifer adhaerens]UAX96376.1 sugar ABC transporter permease [Ensifer adhaerens]UAY04281.1 sugar ABC transporter permease [Ensifer adhaerens]UAY12267.1 sugar ABC transporter permease [Ensifer adhaerens]
MTSAMSWNFREFSWIGTGNFVELARDITFWKAFTNTLLYCAGTVFLQVPFGVLAGILISQKLRGWQFYRAALFIPVVISGPAFALTFSIFYNPEYGLLNTVLGWFGLFNHRDWLFDFDTALPAVVATYVFVFGFVMILVATEIDQIPKDLYEAASIDGATWLQRELKITLPLLRHIIGTCLLLTLLGTIKLFDVIYIMTKGGPADQTTSLGTYGYSQYVADRWGYANAIGTVTVILGIMIIVSVRRLFRLHQSEM